MLKRQPKLSGNGRIKYRRKIKLFKPDSLSILPEIDIDGSKKVLDVGCSNGRLLKKLAQLYPNVEFHGVDIDAKIINKNKKENDFPNLHFHHASAENLPFDNESFDIVITTNTMGEFKQRVRSLDEMYRVLKRRGECFILEGVKNRAYREKFDKILRQCKFIRPRKKFIKRTALLKRSYFIHYTKIT